MSNSAKPSHVWGLIALAGPPTLTALSSGTAVAAICIANSDLALAYLGTWVPVLLVCAGLSLLAIIQSYRWRGSSKALLYCLAALLGPVCCLILVATVAFTVFYFSLRYGE